MNPVSSELIKSCSNYFDENTIKIVKCLNELTDQEIWVRPNEASNSIGNLILHLCGNIRQYAIASLGRKKDVRKRDLEFSTKDGHSRNELAMMLKNTVTEAKEIFAHLDDHELIRVRPVQAYTQSGVHILIHVTEHYSYHTGQIVFMTKQLKNKDLGFYADIDLNQTRQ